MPPKGLNSSVQVPYPVEAVIFLGWEPILLNPLLLRFLLVFFFRFLTIWVTSCIVGLIGLDPIITDNPDGFDFLGLYPVQELGINYLDMHTFVNNRQIEDYSGKELCNAFPEIDEFTLNSWKKEWKKARQAMLDLEF